MDSQLPLKNDVPTKKYTVIKPTAEQSSSRRTPPTAPPKVISHKDLLKPKPDFTYYDAVLASEKQAKIEDQEMNNFIPLLEEYLKRMWILRRYRCVHSVPRIKSMTHPRLSLPVHRADPLKRIMFGTYFIIALQKQTSGPKLQPTSAPCESFHTSRCTYRGSILRGNLSFKNWIAIIFRSSRRF